MCFSVDRALLCNVLVYQCCWCVCLSTGRCCVMFLYISVLLMCFSVDRALLCNVLVYLSVVDVFLCRQGVAV